MKLLVKKGKINAEAKIACVFFVLFLGFIIFAVDYLIPSCIDRRIADLYCDHIFEWVALPSNILTGVFSTSITEMLIVTAVLIGIFLLFYSIYRTIRYILGCGSSRYPARAFTFLVLVLLVTIFMSSAYNLMHGINFKRTPAYARLGISLDDDYSRSFQTYLAALNWAYMGMVQNREKLGVDYEGVAHLSSSFEQCVSDANDLMDSFSYTYDLGMSKTFIRAKAVSLSRLWSSTHIVGMYDPFLGETNINTDYMDILDLPLSICHEIAHAKGYARESDANTIAALALIHSDRADFKYAGYYYIFNNLYPTVSRYASETGETIPNYFADRLCEGVINDMEAQDRYWDYIESGYLAGTIEDISEKVNNTFLEANGQTGGTQTYHVPRNIFVEFYCLYVDGRTNG